MPGKAVTREAMKREAMTREAIKRTRPSGSRDGEHGGGEAARELAIAALGFIAGDAEHLSRFLALSGIEPGSIRAAAVEPGFLAGVLAYISNHEATLITFAAHAGVAPERIEQARRVLSGADWERDVP